MTILLNGRPDIINMMTDWIPDFEDLFKLYKPKTILEFGLGEGTKFLSENCEKIRSIELATKDTHYQWVGIVKGYNLPNWDVSVFPVQDKFTRRMKKYITNVLKAKYDLIFVDPGVHSRAEIVNLCFGKANIIVAHDTNDSAYGWEKVQVTNSYTQVKRIRTTFWFKDKELAGKLV